MNTALLTTAQVAETLQLSKMSLWRLERIDPTFPRCLRIGRAKRYPTADVHKWIAERPGTTIIMNAPTTRKVPME